MYEALCYEKSSFPASPRLIPPGLYGSHRRAGRRDPHSAELLFYFTRPISVEMPLSLTIQL